MGHFRHEIGVAHHRGHPARAGIGQIGPGKADVAHAVGIELLAQVVHDGHVLRCAAQVDSHISVVRLIQRGHYRKLQVLGFAGIDQRRGDHLGIGIFVTRGERLPPHPQGRGTGEFGHHSSRDAALVEVRHHAPELLEVRPTVHAVEVGPVRQAGAGVGVGGFPVTVADKFRQEQRHARLVNQGIDHGLQFIVGPASRVSVDAKAVDNLVGLRAVDYDGPRARQHRQTPLPRWWPNPRSWSPPRCNSPRWPVAPLPG